MMQWLNFLLMATIIAGNQNYIIPDIQFMIWATGLYQKLLRMQKKSSLLQIGGW